MLTVGILTILISLLSWLLLGRQFLFFSMDRAFVFIDGNNFHEKGVDVRLAVEMIRFARSDKYDIAYLLSSDTDLVAAVEDIQPFLPPLLL